MAFKNIKNKSFKCKTCNKQFYARHSYDPKYNKFCCRGCALKSTLHFKNKRSPHWKHDLVREINCQYCGILVKNVPRKDIRRLRKENSKIAFSSTGIGAFQKQKFCSPKCGKLGGSFAKGKNNPNYNGGKSVLRQVIMGLREYKEWRTNIFQRDNYTCQHCKKRGGYLEVDHIKPFIKIIREFNIKTNKQAQQCDELWDINNGRTLCRKCHTKTFIFLGNQYTA